MARPARSAEDTSINWYSVLRPHPAPTASSPAAANANEPRNSTKIWAVFCGCSDLRPPGVTTHTYCTTRIHGQFEKGDTQIIPTESACAANASDQRGDPIRRDRSPGHGNFTRTDESVSNLVSGEISVRKARSHHRPQATHGPARPVADHFSRYPEGIWKKIVEDRGTSPRPPHSAKSRPLRRQNHSRELLECAPCSGV